jgi:hypothetical protein
MKALKFSETIIYLLLFSVMKLIWNKSKRDIVSTFVNVIIYPQYNYNMLIKNRAGERRAKNMPVLLPAFEKKEPQG